MGIRGRDGLALDGLLGRRPEDVPRRADRRLPQLLLPRRPARRGRQQPPLQRRPGRLHHRHAHCTCATTATTPSRSTRRPRSEWTAMVDRGAAKSPFGESSYFFGTNIPGKPRKYLLNSGGRPKLFKEIAEVRRQNDYQGVPPARRPLSRQTVATGVSGEPTAPGQPQRRRGEQEAAAVVLAQPRRQLVQVPHLAERDAQLEQAEVVDRQERVPALVAVPADQPLDRVVVRHQRRDLRLGDPLEQRRRRGRRDRCTSCGSSPGPGRGSTRGPWWRSRCAAGACRPARRRRRRPP